MLQIFKGAHLITSLAGFVEKYNRLLVLTGAGVSTASGIPDYRDKNGKWKQKQPIYYQDFVRSHRVRQRYWARSAVGWVRFAQALPGKAHHALAHLESLGKISRLITQNVDRLHQQAGSSRVIDLHGTLQQVVCIDCQNSTARSEIQHFLLHQNPQLQQSPVVSAPDGDAHLEQHDFSSIKIPGCERCGGILKPDVVFYGENVPAGRVKDCYSALTRADAMLVTGSSLMVYSGFRFVRHAHEMGLPIVAINRGVTRADKLLSLKIEQDCGDTLTRVIDAL